MASVDALEGEKDNRAFAAWRSEGRLPSRMAWISVTGAQFLLGRCQVLRCCLRV